MLDIIHPIEKNRHQQGGALIIGNFPAGHAADKEFDFGRRKFAAVTFLPDDVLWSQEVIVSDVGVLSLMARRDQIFRAFKQIEECLLAHGPRAARPGIFVVTRKRMFERPVGPTFSYGSMNLKMYRSSICVALRAFQLMGLGFYKYAGPNSPSEITKVCLILSAFVAIIQSPAP